MEKPTEQEESCLQCLLGVDKRNPLPDGLSQGESFLGRKWLIGKKIKKELDKPEGLSHAKMV